MLTNVSMSTNVLNRTRVAVGTPVSIPTGTTAVLTLTNVTIILTFVTVALFVSITMALIHAPITTNVWQTPRHVTTDFNVSTNMAGTNVSTLTNVPSTLHVLRDIPAKIRRAVMTASMWTNVQIRVPQIRKNRKSPLCEIMSKFLKFTPVRPQNGLVNIPSLLKDPELLRPRTVTFCQFLSKFRKKYA